MRDKAQSRSIVRDLPRSEWEVAYKAELGCRPCAGLPKPTLSADWSRAVGFLDKELGKKWEKSSFGGNDKDYALSDEPSNMRQLSMGIYSRRIFCPDFVASLQRVLRIIEPSYLVHVACEMDSTHASCPPWGEMFVTTESVVICSDSKGLADFFREKD